MEIIIEVTGIEMAALLDAVKVRRQAWQVRIGQPAWPQAQEQELALGCVYAELVNAFVVVVL